MTTLYKMFKYVIYSVVTLISFQANKLNNMLTFIRLQEIVHSGCDAFQHVGVEYRKLKPKTTEWRRMYVGDVTDTQLAIRLLDNDEYELKVTALNNEGISSSSKITNAALSPGE